MSQPVPIRCPWAGQSDLLMAYHDREWGVPMHDDRLLFETLALDGFQAGLSWMTILRKRDRFRQVFDGFDPARVAAYGEQEIARLLADPGIVRNRQKIEATIQNARRFLELQQAHGSFDAFIWGYVDRRPIHNGWRTLGEIPAKTELSDRISRDLKSIGFRFVGSTICYAWMQAVGMVNDHTADCFRHAQLAQMP